MTKCEATDGVSCSYVNVTVGDRNESVFTWWMTLGRDQDTSTVVTAQFVTLLIITIVAVIANIIILTVVLSDRKLMKIPTHQFVATLSVNHLSFISIAPMLLVCRKAYTWRNSVAMCKSMLYIFAVSGCNSIWVFVFISMDRYFKVVQAVRETRLGRIYPKHPTVAIAIMACVSMTYYIPLIVFFDVFPVVDDRCTNSTKCFLEYEEDKIYICVVVWSNRVAAAIWFVGQMLLCYVIPLVFICYNYFHVYMSVRKVGRRIQARRSGQRKVSKREMEIRVSYICSLLVTVFIVMWTPIFIVLILTQFTVVGSKSDGIISADQFYWVVVVTLSNSAINPLIYAACNTKFIKSWENYRSPLWDYCTRLTRLTKKPTNKQVTPSEETEASGDSSNEKQARSDSSAESSTKNENSNRKIRESSTSSNKHEVSVTVSPPAIE